MTLFSRELTNAGYDPHFITGMAESLAAAAKKSRRKKKMAGRGGGGECSHAHLYKFVN